MIEILPKCGGIALDLGAGDGSSRKMLEGFGYRWVGLDIIKNKGLSIVGDGCNLPFQNETFDIVISIAVLEHIRDPWRAMAEINRIIKPEGRFMGTVAFLEPFHGSYFHFTHLGLQEILSKNGFEIEYLFQGWHMMESMERSLFLLPLEYPMRLIAKMIMLVRKTFILFILLIQKYHKGSRFAMSKGKKFLGEEKFRFSGSLVFLAHKSSQ